MKKAWVLSYPSSAQRRVSDQTGRLPRLIWMYTGRTVISLVLSCCGSNHYAFPSLVFEVWKFMPRVLRNIYRMVVVSRSSLCFQKKKKKKKKGQTWSRNGFRNDRGTIDTIFTARHLQEKCQELNVNTVTVQHDVLRHVHKWFSGLWWWLSYHAYQTPFWWQAVQPTLYATSFRRRFFSYHYETPSRKYYLII